MIAPEKGRNSSDIFAFFDFFLFWLGARGKKSTFVRVPVLTNTQTIKKAVNITSDQSSFLWLAAFFSFD